MRALVLLLLLPTVALAQEPIKDLPAFEEKLAQLRRSLAQKHCDMARKLEKKHPREARDELLLALTLQPDHKKARDELGYTRDGDRWMGAPPPIGMSEPLTSSLQKELAKEHRTAAQLLRTLALRAKLGGLVEPARDAAALALEEEPDDKQARELCGHVNESGAWLSEREKRIRAAFAKVLQSPYTGEERTDADDVALGKIANLGELGRRETPHAVLLWVKTAPELDPNQLIRMLEASYSAYRYFFAGEPGFKVDGEPAREASGARPAPQVKPRWFVVGPDPDHATFIERTVPDKKLHDFAKKLAGYSTRVDLDGKRSLLVIESRFNPKVRNEWASSTMAEFLTQASLGRAKVPSFVSEGIKRFFGGHASGRADIFYSSAGTSTGKRAFSGGSFDQLRAQVRPAMQELLPENELRGLLAKSTNELERADSARALAFFEFLLDAHRPELTAFLTGLKPDEAPLATFERCFKKPIDELERAWREWTRREY